jgi:hypothetical protein
MRPIKVFIYVDSGAMVSHCVAAAELIRKQLGAGVTMMLVDTEKNFNETMKNYEVYDYRDLLRIPQRPTPVWSPSAKIEKKHSFGFGLRRLFHDRIGGMPESNLRSALAISKRISRRCTQVMLVLPIFILIGTVQIFRLLRIAKFFKKIVAFLRSTRMGQSNEQWLWLLVSVNGVNRFLRAIEPDVIVLPEDNIETLSTIFVARGAARNIPSIIIPFTIPNPLEPARYYLNNPLYQAKGLFARIVTAYYPKWRIRHEGKDLLRQPAIKALCQEMLGLSSPAPWILNRGGAFSVALDSEVQRDLYLKLGFPPGQLRVTGDVNGEALYRGWSNRSNLVEELCTRYGLRPGRPLILCGFPPDQYEGTDTSRYEFPSYDTLVQAWMGSFKALGERANILVRPHPRVPFDRLARFEDPNIKLTWQPTAELIPLCDLYAASISATIRWAIACGIPTVNYDTFRYRYADYDSAAGVTSVERLDDFRALVARFVDDPVFAAELTKRQQSVMKYWGQPDGKVAERLSALIVEAVSGAGRLSRG